jgi:hypothetical protein
VAGVDFGALGSCVTLPDSAAYQLRMALSAYPLRGREELDRAIDHIYGVAKAAQTGVAETVFAARSTLCLPDKTSIPRLAADVGMKSTSPLTERCTLALASYESTGDYSATCRQRCSASPPRCVPHPIWR